MDSQDDCEPHEQNVGKLIHGARKASGMTQVELALRSGTSQPALVRYESGRVSPSITTLERLLLAAGSRLELKTVPVATRADFSLPRVKKLREAKDQIIRLAHQAGASHVRIFGSVVRGEDDSSSDIDLLVDYDLDDGLIPLIKLNDSLSELLGEPVDVAPVTLLKPDVAERVLAEALPL